MDINSCRIQSCKPWLPLIWLGECLHVWPGVRRDCALICRTNLRSHISHLPRHGALVTPHITPTLLPGDRRLPDDRQKIAWRSPEPQIDLCYLTIMTLQSWQAAVCASTSRTECRGDRPQNTGNWSARTRHQIPLVSLGSWGEIKDSQ